MSNSNFNSNYLNGMFGSGSDKQDIVIKKTLDDFLSNKKSIEEYKKTKDKDSFLETYLPYKGGVIERANQYVYRKLNNISFSDKFRSKLDNYKQFISDILLYEISEHYSDFVKSYITKDEIMNMCQELSKSYVEKYKNDLKYLENPESTSLDEIFAEYFFKKMDENKKKEQENKENINLENYKNIRKYVKQYLLPTNCSKNYKKSAIDQITINFVNDLNNINGINNNKSDLSTCILKNIQLPELLKTQNDIINNHVFSDYIKDLENKLIDACNQDKLKLQEETCKFCTYMFRAEAKVDADQLISKLGLKTNQYFIKQSELMGMPIPDVDVEFKSDKTLYEIRKIMIEIQDSHVMLESLNIKEKYNGERWFSEYNDDKEIVKQVQDFYDNLH